MNFENIFENIEFLNPEYFWGLLLVPIIIYFFYKKEKLGIDFIFFKDLKKVFKSNNIKFYLKIFLLFLILINFIVILANPNKINVDEKVKKNGIDIVFALDVSGSMEAEDLKPNRLEAAKKVINDFIGKLKTDRVGLVVFAGKPFTSIPLTFDYNIVKETVDRLDTKTINQEKNSLNGTAIGDAILMGETLFKPHPNPLLGEEREQKEKKREKVIILLTDGDANVGVDPILASFDAKKQNIKIYTIGIGSKTGGYVTYKVGPFIKKQKMPPLNDKVLKEIAKNTSGEFFRADSNYNFSKIFEYLSKLEKNDIEIKINKTYKEYYEIFVYSLIILLIIFSYLIFSNLEFKKQ